MEERLPVVRHDIAFAHPLDWLIKSSFFSPFHTLAPCLPSASLWTVELQERCLGWGRGRTGILFQCCLQLPLLVWCLVFSCRGLRIWGRTGEEKELFSALQDESMTMKSVCMFTHTCSVCSLHTHTAGPILSSYTGVINTCLWATAYIFCFKRAYKYYIYTVLCSGYLLVCRNNLYN